MKIGKNAQTICIAETKVSETVHALGMKAALSAFTILVTLQNVQVDTVKQDTITTPLNAASFTIFRSVATTVHTGAQTCVMSTLILNISIAASTGVSTLNMKLNVHFWKVI